MLAPRDHVAAVLLGAADYIERHGWCQGSATTGTHVCAAWALTIAAGDDVTTSEQAGLRLMRSVYGAVSDAGIKTVPAWNDRIGRTKEEVVEALRSAALAAA